jgi:nitroreductase
MTHTFQEKASLPSGPMLAQMTARTHVAPKRLVEPGPSQAQLDLIYRAAAQAPNHGRIQAWRFVVIPQNQRSKLGDAFVQALLQRNPDASEEQMEAAREKAFRAPCLMLAVVNSSPSEPPVPLSERLISLGCAIQNMLLMAQSMGLGSGITSGQAMNADSMRALFAFTEHEEGICFLNFGTVASHKGARPQAEPASFVSSL